jgi:hypothetical protein
MVVAAPTTKKATNPKRAKTLCAIEPPIEASKGKKRAAEETSSTPTKQRRKDAFDSPFDFSFKEGVSSAVVRSLRQLDFKPHTPKPLIPRYGKAYTNDGKFSPTPGNSALDETGLTHDVFDKDDSYAALLWVNDDTWTYVDPNRAHLVHFVARPESARKVSSVMPTMKPGRVASHTIVASRWCFTRPTAKQLEKNPSASCIAVANVPWLVCLSHRVNTEEGEICAPFTLFPEDQFRDVDAFLVVSVVGNATCSYSTNIHVWNMLTEATITVVGGPTTRFACSGNGRLLVTLHTKQTGPGTMMGDFPIASPLAAMVGAVNDRVYQLAVMTGARGPRSMQVEVDKLNTVDPTYGMPSLSALYST